MIALYGTAQYGIARYGLNLITDRTGGYYNVTDLNRVEGAVEYLVNRFAAQGYLASPDDIKTTWSAADIPRVADTVRYLGNITEVRSKITTLETTPDVPEDMQGFTHTEANDIEKILIDIDTLLTNAKKAWFYSGEIYSGEV